MDAPGPNRARGRVEEWRFRVGDWDDAGSFQASIKPLHDRVKSGSPVRRGDARVLNPRAVAVAFALHRKQPCPPHSRPLNSKVPHRSPIPPRR
jgi:hypothetical protein